MLRPDPAAGRARREVLGVIAFLRAAARTVDLLVNHDDLRYSDPDLHAVLIETSQATHRALVILGQVTRRLTEPSGRDCDTRRCRDSGVPSGRGLAMSRSMPAEPFITCYAAVVALEASQIRRAWHAGVIDADTGMHRLDGVLCEVYNALDSVSSMPGKESCG